MKFTLIRAVYLIFLTGLLLSFIEGMAQKGNVKGKSLYMVGTLTNRGIYRNNREIEFIKVNETQTRLFHPADLSEFRFDDGDLYVSKVIDDNGVKTPYFLLVAVRGNANLYVLKTKKGYRFFGDKKDQLIELEEGSLETTLPQVLNRCPGFEKSFPLIKRTKPSLSRAFSLHNRCYSSVFPRTRVGISVGYSTTSFEVPNQQYTYVPLQDVAPVIGVFIETPIGLKPKWSMNMQIQYQQNSYRSPEAYRTRSDYQIKTTGLNFPILFKYRSKARSFRPFFLAGPTLSCFVQRQSNLIETITNMLPPTVFVRRVDNISQFQLAATLGIGTEYSLNLKNSVSLELRYSTGSGIRMENNQKISGWQLMCSVYF